METATIFHKESEIESIDSLFALRLHLWHSATISIASCVCSVLKESKQQKERKRKFIEDYSTLCMSKSKLKKYFKKPYNICSIAIAFEMAVDR